MSVSRSLPAFPLHISFFCSFGKGEHFWTDVFPSPLTARLAHDICKFGRVLKTVKFLEGVLALIPKYALLRLLGFPKTLGNGWCIPSPRFFWDWELEP